ncbi:FtsK/SpoIIIE domain-containing protein [Phaeacidiphilus oryzae]|uniref:FtsK/SpoIIIE domain-containing protein n=1 Tax=Phaeacidiphilus oryzae TaxID=348818 RepID=UPI00068B4316|nr:FtsK/SpoIIIE domain-containing protein [Phaeacidiphilus oryzae]
MRPARGLRPRPSIHPITAARARRFLLRSRNAISGREPFPPLPTLSRRPAAPSDPAGHPGGARGGRGLARSATLAAERQAAELRDRWPDPAAVLLTALGPGPRLWERSPEHPDALTVRLGSSAPGAVGVPPTAIDLRAVGSLGLAGARPRLSALARAVVAQLATWHGPSVLELVLVAADAERPLPDRTEDWSWLYWLPHLRPHHDQPCRLLVGLDQDQAVARLGELTARTDAGRPAARAQDPLTVVVVDGDPGSGEAADAVERLLAAGPARGIFPIVLAEHPAALPPGLGAVAALGGEVGTLLRLDAPSLSLPEAGAELAADMVSAEWAERLARALAPLREPADSPGGRAAGDPGRTSGPLPSSVRLLDLLELESVTPAKLSARWASVPPTADAVTAVLGATRDGGPCAIDLADSGGMPGAAGHVLVAGDRGSGKTELLRTLIASLAVAEGPDRLRITVLEGRPGAAGGGLASCTELPQVTDCRASADRGAADALLAELAHREQQFAGRGFAAWYAEYALSLLRGAGAAASAPPPPRRLIVVDDLEQLLRADGDATTARALSALAARGARVGIHLVVATAAPEALAGSALDEAAQLRIGLRLDDPAASRALLHLDDAAGIPADRPGRAYVRYPDGGVTAFQTALVSGRIPRTATLRPTVVALDWSEMGAPPTRRPVRELGNGPTDLALLASALTRAATPVPR